MTRSTLPAATWYFYPRSPCGERPVHYIYLFCLVCISIHALLAESDRSAKSFFCGILVISIHALLAESDWESNVVDPFVELFLSTLSLRRATMLALNFCTVINISIHALLAESDCVTCTRCGIAAPISIHALLAESDPAVADHAAQYTNFYPRSPCGERPAADALLTQKREFLSTLSLRRATLCSSSLPCSSRHFYPRSPCGERPTAYYACPIVKLFLSTLSLRRATLWPISCFKSP